MQEKNEYPYQVWQVAAISYECLKAYVKRIEGVNWPDWNNASIESRHSTADGVLYIKRLLDKAEMVSPADVHANWMIKKEDAGWKYGEVKDLEAKTHPCMVPFRMLPEEEKGKDYLMLGVVTYLLAFYEDLPYKHQSSSEVQARNS